MKKISFIIPFFNGNEYITRALESIKQVYNEIKEYAEIEIIIVNDSPGIEVKVSDLDLEYRIITNEKNYGIHKARINGLNAATGEYIQFLDQDDELIVDGYYEQLSLMGNSDIVVGNGDYHMGDKSFKIFRSLSSMKYLVQFKRLLKIRNLIPSPGECLIKKDVLPQEWIDNPLTISGADDWMLWIILFKQKARFALNPKKVYRHNSSNKRNCSADLTKMRCSAMEANDILTDLNILSAKESSAWRRAIEFKYLQDSGQLKLLDLFRFWKEIVNNVIYKAVLFFKDHETAAG